MIDNNGKGRMSFIYEPATINYRGQQLVVERNTTVKKLMTLHPDTEDENVVAAIVNNKLVSLEAKILRSGTVQPVLVKSKEGARIYRQHLTLMLYEVFFELFPQGGIKIGQSISEGYYFEVSGVPVDDTLIQTIKSKLQALALEKTPFRFSRVPVEEARRMFARTGSEEKRLLLDRWHSSHVSIVSLKQYSDFCFGPVAPHTGFFDEFDLWSIDNDLVLQFPDLHQKKVARLEFPQPKLYQTYKRSKRWSKLLGVSHLGDLNSACIDGSIKEIIKVAEGLHEKEISKIADDVIESGSRLVFVAGPSSAGKTTFAKRLSVQLKVAGMVPKALSLDNYYVDRVDTVKDEDGNYDFEALEAIDLTTFNSDLKRILAGEDVLTPVFNFTSGTRVAKEKWIPISLGKKEILIIEGIHGLNDALSSAISNDDKYRVYINALSPLAIDSHNRLHTSDTRLIRRLVRDRHYRGYTASATIASWPSVRRGERRHIFPFQKSADVIFDTSLIYEFSVLKIFADRYLLEVPRCDPAYAEAYRLRQFMSMFVPILHGDVPATSLMREFIGGSNFSY